MHSTQDELRANMLAAEAVNLVGHGKSLEAANKLREAISLGPNNPKVQRALQEVESGQKGGPLSYLCWRYVSNNDDQAADEMLAMLRDPQSPGSSGAIESLRLILQQPPTRLSSKQDQLIAKLALSSATAREIVATKFRSSPTEFFDDLYDRGNESINCLRAIVLDMSCWKSSDIQASMKQDLFQLLLAKLMESGHDLDARALKNIALLLASDAPLLSSFVDEDAFDALLTSLDYRQTDDIKSQATLALSKVLEVQQELGQKYFTDFIVAKVERQRKNDMVIAFSAAAAIFPLAPSMTATLFLTDGFLSSLIPLLDGPLKHPAVTTSFLKLLNAASMDEACRSAIFQHCSDWLSHIMSNGTLDQTAMAATVLAKIRTGAFKKEDQQTPQPQDTNVDDLVKLFKTSLHTSTSGSVATSIEGLAYTSLKPEVKDSLGKDTALLTSLFQHIKDNLSNPEIVVGGLSIISNMTQYQPTLTEEQKKMAELKAYANTAKLPSMSPLNDEEHTSARCAIIIDTGVVPLLIECVNKSRSATTKQLASNIMLSLSKNSKTRGKIAQQGGVKLLLSILNASATEEVPSPQPPYYFSASHALARILISINPMHVFPSSGNPSAISAIRPLVTLLSDEPVPSNGLTSQSPLSTSSSTEPRTLLPTFEALLALTNLASYPEPTPATVIVRLAFAQIEDLLLSSHKYIQRAACELICNLMACEAGIAKYADTVNDHRARGRIHLLLALCDVDDLPTRKAAGGALAMLTDFPTVLEAILNKEKGRGVENLLGLCGDENDEVILRGVVCLRNLICGEDNDHAMVEKAKALVKEKGGVNILKDCLRRAKEQQTLELGVEVLKTLV